MLFHCRTSSHCQISLYLSVAIPNPALSLPLSYSHCHTPYLCYILSHCHTPYFCHILSHCHTPYLWHILSHCHILSGQPCQLLLSVYTDFSLITETKMRRPYKEYPLAVPINCVITTRLKEGFTIQTVDTSKGMRHSDILSLLLLHGFFT